MVFISKLAFQPLILSTRRQQIMGLESENKGL